MATPFNRILLATEGTEFDVGAERVGIDLAQASGVPLLAVLPLVSNVEYQIRAPQRQEEAEAEAAAKLRTLQEAAAARGVELRGNVRLGEQPFREIVDEAKERNADLIVLRRRGKRSYIANLFMGEMVHTVIGHAHCDVLIVPRAAAHWSRGIVLATDGSPHSERATALAAQLAAQYRLPLTVISVAEHKDPEAERAATANVDRALAAARAAGAEAVGRIVSGEKPFQAILAAEKESDADLIVIGRRGLNALQRLMMGSTSERVAGSANGAVLIVQEAVTEQGTAD